MRVDNYQHFDINRDGVIYEEEKGKGGETKVEIKEIRIRKLGDGYQYEHLQDNGVAVATKEITGFAAIRSVVGAIERWEEEGE